MPADTPAAGRPWCRHTRRDLLHLVVELLQIRDRAVRQARALHALGLGRARADGVVAQSWPGSPVKVAMFVPFGQEPDGPGHAVQRHEHVRLVLVTLHLLEREIVRGRLGIPRPRHRIDGEIHRRQKRLAVIPRVRQRAQRHHALPAEHHGEHALRVIVGRQRPVVHFADARAARPRARKEPGPGPGLRRIPGQRGQLFLVRLAQREAEVPAEALHRVRAPAAAQRRLIGGFLADVLAHARLPGRVPGVEVHLEDRADLRIHPSHGRLVADRLARVVHRRHRRAPAVGAHAGRRRRARGAAG
jgi:hypothetical protein